MLQHTDTLSVDAGSCEPGANGRTEGEGGRVQGVWEHGAAGLVTVLETNY